MIPTSSPAFPSSVPNEHEGVDIYWGMTLRDYFAAHALAMFGRTVGDPLGKVAADAYLIADALLVEREKGQP